MEQIMNEENEWDHATKADMIERPVERITHDEIVKTIGSTKTRKAPGPSEFNAAFTRDVWGKRSCQF